MKNIRTEKMAELAILTNLSFANKDFNKKFGRDMTAKECCNLMSMPNFQKNVNDFLDQLEKETEKLFNSAG